MRLVSPNEEPRRAQGPQIPPVVTLVGDDRLRAIGGFLALGAVVIVMPDEETARRWHAQQADAPAERQRRTGLQVDLAAHCVRWGEKALALTELEFRLLSALAASPGRGWSFHDLFCAGWAAEAMIGADAATVRSVVQRLRRKLAASKVEFVLESIRGFGYRLSPTDPAAP